MNSLKFHYLLSLAPFCACRAVLPSNSLTREVVVETGLTTVSDFMLFCQIEFHFVTFLVLRPDISQEQP